jgi:hypothetical protein
MSGCIGSEDCDALRYAASVPSGSLRRTKMIRPIFTEFALFMAPFVAYALYLWATRAGVLDGSSWALPRLMWLTIAALVLVIASFLALAEFGGAPPGSTYVPAHMENGRLVPGAER